MVGKSLDVWRRAVGCNREEGGRDGGGLQCDDRCDRYDMALVEQRRGYLGGDQVHCLVEVEENEDNKDALVELGQLLDIIQKLKRGSRREFVREMGTPSCRQHR